MYEQEAFVLTYKIYTRESNLQLNNAKLPDFKGFHSQEIEMTTNARWTPEHYQGRNYYTTVYRQFVLFPQQSGKLYIDPAQFQMTSRINLYNQMILLMPSSMEEVMSLKLKKIFPLLR